jgi:hypothetical protein
VPSLPHAAILIVSIGRQSYDNIFNGCQGNEMESLCQLRKTIVNVLMVKVIFILEGPLTN